MKPSASASIDHYLHNPNAECSGYLLYAEDPAQLFYKKQILVRALQNQGDNNQTHHNCTTVQARDLVRDPAQLIDTLCGQGFFDTNVRIVVLEGAFDRVTHLVKNALDQWRKGDGRLVVTAQSYLKPKSSLRQLFEKHASAYAIPIYNTPIKREAALDLIKAKGLTATDQDAVDAVLALAYTTPLYEFEQIVEKIALYTWVGNGQKALESQRQFTVQDVTAFSPEQSDIDLDTMTHAVFSGHIHNIAWLLRNALSSGLKPVGISIGVMRYGQTLYKLASQTQSPALAVNHLRPPLFGSKRTMAIKHCQQWSLAALSRAMRILTHTDIELRGFSPASDRIVLERALVNIATIAHKSNSRC